MSYCIQEYCILCTNILLKIGKKHTSNPCFYSYVVTENASIANELQAIPRKKRCGYKLLPEEVDEKVIKLVKEMQSSGAAMYV